jgi:predicted DNA-binding transcriptional regulator AlpA
MHTPSPEQVRFDTTYITAHEIARTLDVSRTTVHHARKRGALPNPIMVGPDMIYIWERAPTQPYIDAMRDAIIARKAVPA